MTPRSYCSNRLRWALTWACAAAGLTSAANRARICSCAESMEQPCTASDALTCTVTTPAGALESMACMVRLAITLPLCGLESISPVCSKFTGAPFVGGGGGNGPPLSGVRGAHPSGAHHMTHQTVGARVLNPPAPARSLRRVLVTQGGVFARCRAHSGPARSLWFPSGSLRRAPARQGLCAWPPRRQRVFCSIGVVAAGHGGSVRPRRGGVHASISRGLI